MFYVGIKIGLEIERLGLCVGPLDFLMAVLCHGGDGGADINSTSTLSHKLLNNQSQPNSYSVPKQ